MTTYIDTVSFTETESPDNTTLNCGSDEGSAIAEMIIVQVRGLMSPLVTIPIEVQSPRRLLSNCKVMAGFQRVLSVFSTNHVPIDRNTCWVLTWAENIGPSFSFYLDVCECQNRIW